MATRPRAGAGSRRTRSLRAAGVCSSRARRRSTRLETRGSDGCPSLCIGSGQVRRTLVGSRVVIVSEWICEYNTVSVHGRIHMSNERTRSVR